MYKDYVKKFAYASIYNAGFTEKMRMAMEEVSKSPLPKVNCSFIKTEETVQCSIADGSQVHRSYDFEASSDTHSDDLARNPSISGSDTTMPAAFVDEAMKYLALARFLVSVTGAANELLQQDRETATVSGEEAAALLNQLTAGAL
jgi:hypothetical protein